jgi:phage shock protein E
MRRPLLLILLTGLLAACAEPPASPDTTAALDAVAAGALLVDVRSDEEVADGSLSGALHIPHSDIVAGLAKLNVPLDQPVVLFCRSGNRAGIAMKALQAAGFTAVRNGGAYDSLRVATRRADRS